MIIKYNIVSQILSPNKNFLVILYMYLTFQHKIYLHLRIWIKYPGQYHILKKRYIKLPSRRIFDWTSSRTESYFTSSSSPKASRISSVQTTVPSFLAILPVPRLAEPRFAVWYPQFIFAPLILPKWGTPRKLNSRIMS